MNRKENDMHTHTMECFLSIKNTEILSFATCMKLEDIMQSKIKQRTRNAVLSHLYVELKKTTDRVNEWLAKVGGWGDGKGG